MKVVIRLDVPEYQIGQDVTVYFPDTMVKRGKCELLKEQDDCENCAIAIEDRQPVVRCKDCKKLEICCIRREDNPDWFCAEGEQK